MGSITNKKLRYKNLEAYAVSKNQIIIYDIISEHVSLDSVLQILEFNETILKISFDFGYLIVLTNMQLHIYNMNSLNTPNIISNKSMIFHIQQNPSYFILIESLKGIIVMSYDGRIQCQINLNEITIKRMNETHLSLSLDTIAIINFNTQKQIDFIDPINGKQIAQTLKHTNYITNVKLSQSGMSDSRKIAFLNSNKDLYIAQINNQQPIKLDTVTLRYVMFLFCFHRVLLCFNTTQHNTDS